ncbi:MAG: glycosyltransferase, partial [Candidatus Omnitrophica bacterium]|nr:glycosyltransferase [Candidatus Omnitrophota bacterium]
MLVLAGRPQEPYASMLRRQADALGIADKVVFTGHITKNDVRDLYHACQVALFPVKSQGGWLAPFEALSAAKPIVTSTTMGAASVISRHDLGIVSDDFAGAIKDIYSRYQEYQEKAVTSCAWVKKHLTWERFTDTMVKVFEETMARRG